jgi:ABC-type phosphate transport system substrate-binding protein
MERLVMKGKPIAPAPKERVIAEMSGVIDAVAHRADANDAIGYSYYYYAKNMWSDELIKYLEINGVAPSMESIADGSYPLSSTIYMAIRQDEPPDSPASRLAEWILSDEGQAVAERVGYVPIR